MKDANARANPTAWVLLDWMVHVLPISQCASHLRDSQFTTILEQTLQENFGVDALAQHAPASDKGSARESSESDLEDAQTSGRKRKRGAAAAEAPSKRAALGSDALAQLFDAVMAVVQSILHKSEVARANEGLAPAELMKMVLKTESAQAARILKSGLVAVNRLITADVAAISADGFNVAPIFEQWNLRTIGTEDQSGASVEEYTTECLIPTLVLLQTLQGTAEASDTDAKSSQIIKDTTNALDRLLVRHVLAPARADFTKKASATVPPKKDSEKAEPSLFSTSLAPLRASLLQAAQMQDSGEPIPTPLLSLFAVVPHLLSLAIRSSPARSLRSKVAERPWIQAAFVALAECAGCTFEIPRFETPASSIDAVQDCLRVLASRDFSIDSDILKDLFWFHSGFEYPAGQAKSVHWKLVESLAELDAEIFIEDPRSKWHVSDDKPDDLTNYLFDKISHANFEDDDVSQSDEMDIDDIDGGKPTLPQTQHYAAEDAVERIIIPILNAYTRNRDLLGFLSRWDTQLSSAKVPKNFVWESPKLSHALAAHFEHSLTSAQISNLFQQHATRLEPVSKPKKGRNAQLFSSVVLVQAMLQSLSSDVIIGSLKPHLLSLWSAFGLWVQKDLPSAITNPGLVWTTLCQLLILLWPIHLHASSASQKEQLYPLLKEASKNVAGQRERGADTHDQSNSRASAMAFLLTACDCLQSLPDAKETIAKYLRRALKSLPTNDFDTEELASILSIFCAEHALLLDLYEPDVSKDLFAKIISSASKVEHDSAKQAVAALSESVFTDGSLALQTACTAALLSIFPDAKHEMELRSLVFTSLLHVVPSSISRDQRESVLDTIVELFPSLKQEEEGESTQNSCVEDATVMLSIMVNLMGVANATAKISSDGKKLFEIVQTVVDLNVQTPPVLQLLRSLARLTLTHILPNRDQSQNKEFLEEYAAQVTLATQKFKQLSPARLAFLVGSYSTTVKGKEVFPLDRYVTLLTSKLERDNNITVLILEALKDIPAELLSNNSETFEEAQTLLRKWAETKISFNSSLPMETTTYASQPPEFWTNLYGVLGRFQLFESHDNLVRFTSSLLKHDLPSQQKTLIFRSLKDSLQPLNASEKLTLLSTCVPVANDDTADVSYRVLHVLISTLDDKQEEDADQKQQQLAILPQLCLLLERSTSDVAFNGVLDSIDTVIRDKTSFTTQQSIDSLLNALCKLTSRSSPRLSTAYAPAIYARICETVRLILILHRSRLGGRFQLLLPLLQGLLLCLFIPNTGRGAALPPWLDPFSALSPTARLTPANAASLTRLLSTLCSPTQSAVTRHSHHHSSKSKTASNAANKDLNDPVKAARDYTAQFAYPLLSAYCRFQLYGRLDANVRAELLPGIRELVGVAGTERDAIDAMFAGLGRSEKDVWRGVWKDWELESGRGKQIGNDVE